MKFGCQQIWPYTQFSGPSQSRYFKIVHVNCCPSESLRKADPTLNDLDILEEN